MTFRVPQCTRCRYYRFNSTRACDAFPDGIPDDVYANRIHHDHPIPGDHGLRYVRATDEEFQAKLDAYDIDE